MSDFPSQDQVIDVEATSTPLSEVVANPDTVNLEIVSSLSDSMSRALDEAVGKGAGAKEVFIALATVVASAAHAFQMDGRVFFGQFGKTMANVLRTIKARAKQVETDKVV